MNKIKISNRQFTIFLSGFMFGSAPLLIASSPAELAGPDAWLSVVFAAAAGLLVIWVNSYLGGRHPDKTFVEIIQLLLGKWVGSVISVCFIFFSLVIATQVVWYIGDFFTAVYVPEMSSYQIKYFICNRAGSCTFIWFGSYVQGYRNILYSHFPPLHHRYADAYPQN